MVKTFGPFDGYFAIVQVVPDKASSGQFGAWYRIRHPAIGGQTRASWASHKQVAGLSATVELAFEIALQLAQLRIAGLRSLRTVGATAVFEKRKGVNLPEFEKAWCDQPGAEFGSASHQATMPCPLNRLDYCRV